MTLPLLIIPNVSELYRVLEDVSRAFDPLMNLTTIVLLAFTQVFTSAVFASLSPSASSGTLIALPILLSTMLPTVTEQLSLLSAMSPDSTLVTSLPERSSLLADQTVSFFTMEGPITDPSVAGPSTACVHLPMLSDPAIRQLIYQVKVGAIEAAGKKKTMGKVLLSTLVLLANPLYTISADSLEGLIEGAFKNKALLIKKFANNYNQNYL